jgi:hypothetical protein
MWAPAQIFSSLLGRGFSAPASADEGTAPNAIFSWASSADSRDQWRAARHNDAVSILTNCWDKSGIESMDTIFSL